MHYIRLLRPLSLDDRGNVKIILTITTDLGDAFLSPPEPVSISVCLHDGLTMSKASKPILLTTSGSRPVWKDGMRVLKLDVQPPSQVIQGIKKAAINPATRETVDICIMASSDPEEPLRTIDLPFDETEGRILGLSAPVSLPGQEPKHLAKRKFRLSPQTSFLELNEEIGESIDRHIWDAGVIAMGAVSNMLSSDLSTATDHVTWDKTPLLKKLLCSASGSQPVNVIELGCGVGILGLGLAAALHARLSNTASEGEVSPSNILLTDLCGAEDLARANISLHAKAVERSGQDPAVILDFERLDWEDGKEGRFGPKVGRTTWDVIIISDCTYNVDMLPALVGTLSALSNKTTKDTNDEKHTRVVLATKPRHASEKALFDLMGQDGWDIVETVTQRLPHLDRDDEVVEIYLFG